MPGATPLLPASKDLQQGGLACAADLLPTAVGVVVGGGVAAVASEPRNQKSTGARGRPYPSLRILPELEVVAFLVVLGEVETDGLFLLRHA